MNQRIEFVDATRVVLSRLDDQLTALGYTTVSTHAAVPSPRPDTFVVARRSGGALETPVSDAALVAVECWARTRADAQDLAQLCRSILHAMPGETVADAFVYRVRDVGAPGDLPDVLSDQPRFTFTVEVVTRGRTDGVFAPASF